MSERKRGVSVHVPRKEKHMRTVDRPALCGYQNRVPTGHHPPRAYTHLVPSDRVELFFRRTEAFLGIIQSCEGTNMGPGSPWQLQPPPKKILIFSWVSDRPRLQYLHSLKALSTDIIGNGPTHSSFFTADDGPLFQLKPVCGLSGSTLNLKHTVLCF